MTSTSPAEKLVGALLNGRWRLVKLLGEGGMGAVYEADSVRGEGKRAVKLLHQEFVKEEQILSRFYAEAQATQQLRHPNVAQVFEGATAEDGTPYLVMELLQGVPLATYMDQGKAIPPAQAAPIIFGVLQALSAAHAKQIIHRDLKPDNLFLVRDQRGGMVVKVLDFGIAKVMDAAGGMGSKTRTGVLLGTPGYMSPEQIKNSKAVDPRSDLWSVGIIFYEMLTNQQPFPADNEFARLTAVLTEEVRPIEKVMPQVASWAPFFVRALAKDPALRFQSADEMARMVQQFASGGGFQVAPSTPTAAQQQSPRSQDAPTQAFAMPPSMQSPMSYGGPQQSQSQPKAHSQPPPPMSAPASSANYNALNMGVPTHVSQLKPQGTPTLQESTPHVAIVSAPPRGRVPVWLVAVVGAVCLGLGFVIGFVVH